jgi:8-oxo-dGTP pyrophosphatase MutT (NUDIX family)
METVPSEKIEILDESQLISLLNAHDIPLDLWGKNDAKTIGHLLRELESGEITLTKEGDSLLRNAIGSALNVYYQENEETLYLKETKQVFKDGRTRTRDLTTSIGEKAKPGEDPLETAQRALSEELGISENLLLTPEPTEIKGPIPSTSYPGLISRFIIYKYKTFIPAHLFKAEGYKEEQEDKTNYFEWVSKDYSVRKASTG